VTSPHAPIRTRYLRTNAFYDPNSLQYDPPRFTVYDAAHRLFFMSNPYLNEIDVFDANQEVQVATISVPMPWGIDLSPIDGSLYAGTLLGDVYHISTATLSVLTRYPANTIGPTGFSASTALVLADGRLALQGSAGGLLGMDGFSSTAVWNPATNALDTGTSIYYASICPYTNGNFMLNGTRTLVLVTTVDENEPLPLCSYDPATRVSTYATFAQTEVTFMRRILPTPDGTRFFLTTNLDGVIAFNARTLQVVGQIPPPATLTGGIELPDAAGGAVMSLDGKTLYLVDQLAGEMLRYDTTTFQQVSSVANLRVNDEQASMVAAAIDETGLIVGPMGHGVGFADAKTGGNAAIATSEISSVSPDTGAVPGGTSLTASSNTVGASLSQFYAGNSLVAGASMASNGQVSASMPAASSGGAVDLTAVLTSGTVALAPEGYSYGPTILEVVPNGATADGGQTGALIGYGFGTMASGLQVSVGGQTAAVKTLYDYAPVFPYPFPVETLTFTIPRGVTGPADVMVTSPSGSATAKGGFVYTPAAVSYPLNATLQQGIYDAHRNLYFFSDAAKIQVLSRTSGTWQTPITLPSTTSSSQLLGIAESPNGSLMAVADFGGQAVYVLNPDNPASAVRYGLQALLAPTGLTVLDNGNVYFATADVGGTGTPAFHKLSTSTKTMTVIGTSQSGGVSDRYIRVLLSPDQSKVYANVEGGVFWVNTADDTVHSAGGVSSNDGGELDAAISGDGNTLDINGYLADGSLHPENVGAYIDWETWLPSATYGQKLSHDGSVLYQPLSDGVDVIERNTGRLLDRVQVPVAVADVYDSMFLGQQAGTVGFINASGVTFVDLSTLAVPSSAATPFPAVRPAEWTDISAEPTGRTAAAMQRFKNRTRLAKAGTLDPSLARYR
jgi:hypothetical protein